MDDYGRHLVVELPYDRTVAATVRALHQRGFTHLTTIDVREVMRRTLNQDFRHYVLLQACHPNLTLRALRADLDVGVLLVATVAVYELADGETVVTVGDPLATIGVTRGWKEEHPDLFEIASELDTELAGALRTIARVARASAA
jgi:uncharacterized protein (DUF302 family)